MGRRPPISYVCDMKWTRRLAPWFGLVLVVTYIAVAWVYSSGAMSGLVKSAEPPLVAGVAPEPVTLTQGEIELDASFYANPANGDCGVVLVHGIDDDRASVLRYAPLYWDLGCSLFAFDQRDHGRSTPAHRTYGFYEADDANAAIGWLMDRTALPPSQIGLHGISYGAATALEVLDQRDDLAFIVADSPYRSMAAIVSYAAKDSLGIAEPLVRPLAFLLIELRANFEVGKVDPADAVVGKATPILLMHTLGDEDVPVDHSERIAEANLAIERHVLEADGVHLHAYELRTDVYTGIVHDFLERKALQVLP